MKYLNSHFRYTKSQRSGILCLLVITVALQLIYSFVDFSSEKTESIITPELSKFQVQIDSLKQVEIESRKPKMYAFNPNFITDFKGYQLGMSTQEIDRLLNFRKQNKRINSPKQFRQVTKVSDSLFNEISPYFKFPDWVIRKNQKGEVSNVSFLRKDESKKVYVKRTSRTTNINQATAEDLATVSGIGEVLSKRIIKYRSKLQGFSYDYQLYEVWNIDPEVIKKLLQVFIIEEKPVIKKLNVNTATFKEVLKNPYIDYDLCKKIFDYRDEVAELQNISELKNIEGFPQNKYERIVLYLEAK